MLIKYHIRYTTAAAWTPEGVGKFNYGIFPNWDVFEAFATKREAEGFTITQAREVLSGRMEQRVVKLYDVEYITASGERINVQLSLADLADLSFWLVKNPGCSIRSLKVVKKDGK